MELYMVEKKNFRISIANNYSKKCFDQVLNTISIMQYTVFYHA